MKVNLSNSTGAVKAIKVGFSWTTFFFGFLPALFRGDLKWAIIILAIEIVLGTFTVGIGAWATGVVFAFIYNKLYINDLMKKGYSPASEQDRLLLQQQKVISPAA